MTTSGSRGQSKMSTDSEPAVISGTPKTSSSKFELVLITKEVKESFCCGVLASTKNDYACTKDLDGCAITSHAKKHDEVKVNHLYIMTMYNPASLERTRRLFNLTDLKEAVSESDLELVFNKLEDINWELYEINAGIDDTIEIFKRLISDLIEAKYKNLSTIHSSSDHENMVLTKTPAFDFDQDIEEMMSAQEMLDSMEMKTDLVGNVEDKKKQDPSLLEDRKPLSLKVDSIEGASSHSDENLVSSLAKHTKSCLISRTIPAKTSAGDDVPARRSNANTAVPSLVLMSTQFVQDLASSDDQGVAVMRSFYQKVLDLELYSKKFLNNKISRVSRQNEEIDKSVQMLINPGSIVP
jgi:hypothetical protein